ncbi:MAG: M23 family metallopeptidase, partial [Firmicutes bacterium]|nr:M23 family metallopeptidase [Bacillota bacterium]
KEVELKAQADALVAEIKKLQDEQRVYEGGVFTWPCPSSHYITYTFGYRYHPVFGDWRFHTGIDISAYTGADIIAAASGKVIMAQWYGGYGNCVMIDHGSGIVTLYGHASALCVSQGQEVSRGQLIARVGSTGWSTGPHLHFEVRINGEYVDPLQYF